MESFTVLAQQKERIVSGAQTMIVAPSMVCYPVINEPIHLFVEVPDQAAKLLALTRCAGIQQIQISQLGAVTIAGVGIDVFEVREFAQDLGFMNEKAFLTHMVESYGLPFDGHVIHFHKPEASYGSSE